MEYILSMTFLTSTGTKNTMTLNGIKPDLTSEQAEAIMDKIIEKDIFLTKAGPLVGKSYAEVTQRKVTKFEYK